MEVELGGTYRDNVTGFEGVATARYEFLNGCVQYLLEGKIDKADTTKRPDLVVDEQRLEGENGDGVWEPVELTATAGGGFRRTP